MWTKKRYLAIIITALVFAVLLAGQAVRAQEGPCVADGEVECPIAEVTLDAVTTVDVASLPQLSDDEIAALSQAELEIRPLLAPPEVSSTTSTAVAVPPATHLDASVSDIREQIEPLAAVGVDFSFIGLGSGDNGNTFVRPPDPQVAVGPNHVVEFVNIVGRIFDKAGVVVQNFALSSFFVVPAGNAETDPKVIYDAFSGRFFASYVSFNDGTIGRLHVAVSQTSDPTGSWFVYILDPTDIRDLANNIPDYPGIGLTNDKFTVSYNLFDIGNNAFRGEQTVVWNKSQMLTGSTVDLSVFAKSASRFTMRPVHSLTSINTQYGVHRGLSLADALFQDRITGVPPSVSRTTPGMTIIANLSPPDAAQSGSAIVIDSGDFRMLEATLRGTKTTVTATGACSWAEQGDPTTRSCVHVIEFAHGTSPSIIDDYLYGAPLKYYMWPAHRTDASSNLHVGFSLSGSTEFVQARVAGRGPADIRLNGSVTLKAGEVPITVPPTPPQTGTRWGDYMGAAVDPSFPDCVYHSVEYARNTLGADWGTWIGRTTYSTAIDPCGTHEVNITAGPSGSPNPVGSGLEADLSVAANDTLGHPLFYDWAADCSAWSGSNGSFDNPTLQNPTWTAPTNSTGSLQNCSMSVTVDDGVGESNTGGYTQGVGPVGAACGGQPATIVGTAGHDVLIGTNGDDVIVGLQGNDLIKGFLGNDLICGGPGNDTLNGGGGADTMFGNTGDDLIDGSSGNDILSGGPGNDLIAGRNGKDTINCGSGIDLADGGGGTADTADANCELTVNFP